MTAAPTDQVDLLSMPYSERSRLAQKGYNQRGEYTRAAQLTGWVPLVVGAGGLIYHLNRIRERAEQDKILAGELGKTAEWSLGGLGTTLYDTAADAATGLGRVADVTVGQPAAAGTPSLLWTTAVGAPLALAGGYALKELIDQANKVKSPERMEKERLTAMYRQLLEAERGLDQKQASVMSPEILAVHFYIEGLEKQGSGDSSLYNLVFPLGVAGAALAGIYSYQAAKKNDLWRDRAAVEEAIRSRREGRPPEYQVAIDNPAMGLLDSPQREVIPIESNVDPEKTRKVVRQVMSKEQLVPLEKEALWKMLEPLSKSAGISTDLAIAMLPGLGAVLYEAAFSQRLMKTAEAEISPENQERATLELLRRAKGSTAQRVMQGVYDTPQGAALKKYFGETPDETSLQKMLAFSQGGSVPGLAQEALGTAASGIPGGGIVSKLGLPAADFVGLPGTSSIEGTLRGQLNKQLSSGFVNNLTPGARQAANKYFQDYSVNPDAYKDDAAYGNAWSNVQNAMFRDKIAEHPIGKWAGGLNNAQWAGILGGLPMLFGQNKGWGVALLAASLLGPKMLEFLPKEMQGQANNMWQQYGGVMKDNPVDYFFPQNKALPNEIPAAVNPAPAVPAQPPAPATSATAYLNQPRTPGPMEKQYGALMTSGAGAAAAAPKQDANAAPGPAPVQPKPNQVAALGAPAENAPTGAAPQAQTAGGQQAEQIKIPKTTLPAPVPGGGQINSSVSPPSILPTPK